MINNLSAIFSKYSDYTDTETIHGYGRLYEQWLSPLCSVERILKIGCQLFGGGSFLAFSERFPASKIVGLDFTFENIIDDAGHEPDKQYRVFCLWNEVLAPDGIYIIEDVKNINALSRKLAEHNDMWEIILGDTRREGTHCEDNSILIGLRRRT